MQKATTAILAFLLYSESSFAQTLSFGKGEDKIVIDGPLIIVGIIGIVLMLISKEKGKETKSNWPIFIMLLGAIMALPLVWALISSFLF